MSENKKRAETESEAEGKIIRQSGLAYAAAFTLFAAVLVMLAVGYMVDLWLDSSPWGLIVGIVLGSAVGLYQFIRISNQLNN